MVLYIYLVGLSFFQAGGGLVLILSKWVLFACGSAPVTNRQFITLLTDFFPDYPDEAIAILIIPSS